MDKTVSRVVGAFAVVLVALVAGVTTSAADTPSSASGDGILAGNAVTIGINIPITLCNPLGALLGTGEGGCIGFRVGTPTAARSSASGDGVLTGNSVVLDLDLPITVAGPTEPAAPAPNPCCPPPTPCCPPPPPVACCVPPTTTPCCVPPPETPPTTTPPEAPPSTTTTTTTVPPMEVMPTGATAAAPDVPRGPAGLPVTGDSSTDLVPIGVGALVAGGMLLAASKEIQRRRRAI